MQTLLLSSLLVNLAAGYDAEFLRVAKAMMWVESKGDPQAVGDHGRSIGPYQIGRAYWSDAMRLLRKSWPYSDARDPVKALAAVYAYTRHYAKAHRRPWVPETIAKIHNGGPVGWKKISTRVYWRKVQQAMQEGR